MGFLGIGFLIMLGSVGSMEVGGSIGDNIPFCLFGITLMLIGLSRLKERD